MARMFGFRCFMRWRCSIICPVSGFRTAFAISFLVDLHVGCSLFSHVDSLISSWDMAKATCDLVRLDTSKFCCNVVTLGSLQFLDRVQVAIESELCGIIRALRYFEGLSKKFV